MRHWRSNVAFIIVVAVIAYVMYKAKGFFGFGSDESVTDGPNG